MTHAGTSSVLHSPCTRCHLRGTEAHGDVCSACRILHCTSTSSDLRSATTLGNVRQGAVYRIWSTAHVRGSRCDERCTAGRGSRHPTRTQWNNSSSPFTERLRSNMPWRLRLSNAAEVLVEYAVEPGLHEYAQEPPLQEFAQQEYAEQEPVLAYRRDLRRASGLCMVHR